MATAADNRSLLEESLLRTAQKYDRIPYQSKPFPQTHPSRMAGIARIFGLEAPPLADMRVLELGCAAGGNIIPHAMRFPDARFVGYDLSRQQVDAGQARIRQLGLSNIEIRCASISELGKEIGEFDYVICHGVYSWVPTAVQDAILRVCREVLSSNGIALVSYNVLPGWRLWQTLRDAFALVIPDKGDELERVKTARNLMDFMKEFTPASGPYGDVLRQSADRLAPFSDDYVAHEYMEDSNEPCSFRDFLVAAGGHGLGYLGESDFETMFPVNRGARFANALRQRTSDDIMSIEQMMDVMTGRTFRQTLLVREERFPAINRQISAESLDGLHYLAPAELQFERKGAGLQVIDGKGRTLTASDPAVRIAIERMTAAFPGTITLAECTAGLSDAQQWQIQDALYRMVISGMVRVMSEPLVCGKGSAAPNAIALARKDAADGLSNTANLRHEPIIIDPISRHLLPALDGGLNRRGIEDLLFRAAQDGRLVFNDSGIPVLDPKRLQKLIQDRVPGMLEGLRRSALLEP